ncbi:Hypothetical predicted protein [Xyrichtys novacula]|uniref:Uncharacterized protein n=1 Tax=Xyrichtys novacula TaxID=13765 RepID=A0AAV1HQG6_XYRNO|nr:Hypothetical predicted protein [Xyrichtys novacula]
MSETLAPGKKKVTAIFDVIFLQMESPIVIVDGGGVMEGSLSGADSGYAAAADEGRGGGGATVDSIGVPPALTGETGLAELLLDTAYLNSRCREDDKDVGAAFPVVPPAEENSACLRSRTCWPVGYPGMTEKEEKAGMLCSTYPSLQLSRALFDVE